MNDSFVDLSLTAITIYQPESSEFGVLIRRPDRETLLYRKITEATYQRFMRLYNSDRPEIVKLSFTDKDSYYSFYWQKHRLQSMGDLRDGDNRAH